MKVRFFLKKLIIKKEEPIKVEEPQTKISENESATTDELKSFDEKKTEEDLEQPTKDDLHNKFEEYTKELEKVIVEKADNEETINKENEIIQKKVEEIKEEKVKSKTSAKSKSANSVKTVDKKVIKKDNIIPVVIPNIPKILPSKRKILIIIFLL